jgi:predicted DNA-binding protein (UPF0251 family)
MTATSFVRRAENAPYVNHGYVTWKHSPWVEHLSSEQVQAAELVGRLDGDFDRVDQLLGLEPGTAVKWFDTDADFARCTFAAYDNAHPGEKPVDCSKGLTPKQMNAAQLYFDEGLRQVDVAKKVGVTTRTLRNWAKDPVFQGYGEALRLAREARLRQERSASELRIHEQLMELREDALNTLVAALRGRDTKVAIEIVRPMLKGGWKA